MKLLRIASQDQLTGLFSNEFSEAITLPPHSSIALLNGVFAMDAKSIYIPSATTIVFSTKGGHGSPDYTATIPLGYYTQTLLLSMLDERLNFAVPITAITESTCFAWQTSINPTSSKLAFSFSRTNNQTFILPTTNFDTSTAASTFKATVDSTISGQYKNVGISDATVLPSCNDIELTPCDTAGAPQDTIPFMYGLLSEKPATATPLTAANFMYGMHNDNSNQTHYIVDGTVVKTVAQSDVDASNGVRIRFSEGNVVFNPGTGVQYTVALTSYNNVGYVLGVALRNKDTQVKETSFNVNPFTSTAINNSNIEMLELPLKQTLHLDSSLGSGETSSQVTIVPSDTLLDLFGFDQAPTSKNLVSGSFTATTSLTSTTTPSSITVELPNLGGNIESYDGISQKRRAIVAVVPSMKQDNGVLTYEPGFPPFIDLNNPFPIQLSKLEIRLLSSTDDSEINLDYPGCTLSFLLNHKSSQTSTK